MKKRKPLQTPRPKSFRYTTIAEADLSSRLALPRKRFAFVQLPRPFIPWRSETNAFQICGPLHQTAARGETPRFSAPPPPANSWAHTLKSAHSFSVNPGVSRVRHSDPFQPTGQPWGKSYRDPRVIRPRGGARLQHRLTEGPKGHGRAPRGQVGLGGWRGRFRLLGHEDAAAGGRRWLTRVDNNAQRDGHLRINVS